jgi:thiamine-phosphate pyrophosphorylase
LTLPDPPVLLITDRHMAKTPVADVVVAAVGSGCRWVLIREKDLADRALEALIRQIRDRSHRENPLVMTSGSAGTAATAGAAGVHLPQQLATMKEIASARTLLGPDALIGVSAHTRAEASAAQDHGADYVSMSPIYLTDSKPGYGPALEPEGFRRETRGLTIPALALGGISPGRLAAVKEAGAAGVAVMGSVMRATDPAGTMRSLIDAWRAA